MGKKLVKINDKDYLFDEATKEVEEVDVQDAEAVETEDEKEEEKEEVEAEEDKKEDVPEDAEEKIQAAADKVVASLGLDKLQKSIKDLESAVSEKNNKATKASDLLELETLLNKDASEMTTSEKIIGFFQAMLQKNEVALKALSEGRYRNALNKFSEFRETLKYETILSPVYI